jgi:hypothetical protein
MISLKLTDGYEQHLKHMSKNVKEINILDEETDLNKVQKRKISKLLNNNQLKLLCNQIINDKYLDDFSYEDLCFMHDTLEDFFKSIKETKADIDLRIFFDKGNVINIKKLKKKFNELGKKETFPNFNFKRLKELFENPPTRLKPMDGSSEFEIINNKFVIRKYLYAIIQMVVNEMDLLIGFTGGEGKGKSCACSQDINLVYYLLKELDLITYDYNIKDMWFNNLPDFLQAEDTFFSEKFRIIGLDEGNELNKQDWRDENVRTFFQRLRRERFNQRIKFICLPQLGELLTSIVLSRMNFVFTMDSKDDVETGTLNKGFCNYYIIPRSQRIYSPHQKREITSDEYIDTLGKMLEDKKKHSKKIPSTLLIKSFKRNNVWGFDKKKYEKYLKTTNKTFSLSKGVKITELQAYYYYISRPSLKEFNINRKDNPEVYQAVFNMDKAICKVFEDNPDKLAKYENLMKRKKEKRDYGKKTL